MKHLINTALLFFAALSPWVAQGQGSESQKDRESFEKDMREAREDLRKATDKIRKLGLGNLQHFSFGHGRGRLGLVLDTDSKGATDGLHVQAVTPGGPADKAGIKAGDVLTAINGKSLVGKGESDKNAYHSLLSETHRAKEGDKVTLDYRRGSASSKAEVTVEVDDDFMFGHKLKALSRLNILSDSWSSLELASLNPDLGQYFGTNEGILVVRAPEGSEVPLKAGDVIQKIGDRKPTSPTQAIRILGSYNPGETVKVEITRQRRSETLNVKIPSRDSGKM